MPLVTKGTPNTAGVEGCFTLVDSGHRFVLPALMLRVHCSLKEKGGWK